MLQITVKPGRDDKRLIWSKANIHRWFEGHRTGGGRSLVRSHRWRGSLCDRCHMYTTEQQNHNSQTVHDLLVEKMCLDTDAQTYLPSAWQTWWQQCRTVATWEWREEEEAGGEEEEGLKGTALMACLHTGEHTCRKRCQITAQPVLTDYQLRKVWGPCVFSKHWCRATERGNHQPGKPGKCVCVCVGGGGCYDMSPFPYFYQ